MKSEVTSQYREILLVHEVDIRVWGLRDFQCPSVLSRQLLSVRKES